jgi:hypothetical protein
MTFRHWLLRSSSRRETERHPGPRRRTRPALETLESRIVPSFKFVTGDTDGTIYAVDTSGNLLWYKDTSRDGSGFSFNAPNEGAVIGTDWNQFTHVIDGGGGILYAVEPNGNLLWYKDTARNGTWGWDPNSGNLIGTGWNVFSQVVSGGNGMLYAIEPNGDLLWYRDLAQNGTPDWAAGSSNLIGTGWNEFIDVISNGNGILYGRNYNGNLLWYQDLAQNGTPDWAAGSGNVVAQGWGPNLVSHMFSGGEQNGTGIIYCIEDDWSVTGVRSTSLLFASDAAQNGSFGSVQRLANPIGTGWVFPTLEGYSSTLSAAPGTNVYFYISTGGSTLTVTWLRLHENLQIPGTPLNGPYGIPQGTSFQVPGQERPVTTSEPWAGAGWDQDPLHPADFTLTVPSWWQSGLFAAQVVDDRGYVLYIPFVVKPSPTGFHNPIAVLVNINTWNSYNTWGGRSRYTGGIDPYSYPMTLSFLRPDPAASPTFGLFYNTESNLHLVPGEVWMLSWLDEAGYGYDVYTDLDFDRGIPDLNQYQTLILDTHPEYWTATMYQNLQGYLNQGGDLLYLGGNGIFDMVQYTPDGTGTIILTAPEYRADPSGSYPWPSGSLFQLNGMDEGQILGVDYYWANAGATGAPYQVSAPGASHFFFQGTGLQAGSLIGQAGIYAPASGWEMDQVWQGGTIPGLQVLATGTNTSDLPADMTYYTTAAGGFVFSTGSITFTNSLAVDPGLQAIIRNALDGILTYQMPAGTSENVTLRRDGNYLDLVDDQTDAIVASGPVGGVRSVRVLGAAGQVEGLTLDYASGGYFPLQRGLLFDGGNFDRLTIVGGGNITEADYQPDSGTDGSGTVELDGMPVGFTNLGLLSVNGVPTLIFDDSADQRPSTYVIDDTLVENGTLIPQVTFSGLSVLDVYGGTAADTFNVGSTSNTATTNLVTGPGNNTVNVGATSGTLSVYNQGGTATVTVGGNQTNAPLSSIQGTVTVDGSGPTTLLVADSSDTRVVTGTVTGNDIGGLSPAPIFYGPGVTSLILDGGSAGDTYDIKSTAARTVTIVNGGPGNDTFNITPSDATFNNNDNFGNITGPLTVNGGGGADLLIIDDQNDTAADTYTIAAGNVQRTGSAGLTYTGIQGVVVNGGSGGDTYNVNSTAAGTPVTINAGSGNDTFNATPSSNNLSNLGALLTVAGGGGTDTLILNDQGDSAATGYAISSSSISRSGSGGVSYSGLSGLAINGGSGTDTFTIVSTAPATPVILNGGGGNDTLLGPNAANTWNITATNAGNVGNLTFSAIQNLTGGGVSDTFRFSNGQGVTGHITGGGGFATLDYSLYASGVKVNLAAGTATGTGGVTGVHNVTGSPFNDTITGDNAGDVLSAGGGLDILKGGTSNDTFLLGAGQLLGTKITGGGGSDTLVGATISNLWTISGANSGKVGTTISFSGIANLVGGSGVDVFKFTGAGKVSGTIDGAGAPTGQGDWLDYSSVLYAVAVNLAAGTATSTGGVNNIQNVHGGNHGNTVTGDAQGNIVIGGSGPNTITGGSGMSLLIADKGTSTITGGSTSGDILIGDSTTYDSMTTAHETALMSILAEWQSADSYAMRFHDINTGTGGGLNGTNKLNWGTTVKDAPPTNDPTYTLTAASTSGLDWFFLDSNDTKDNFAGGDHVNNT